MGYWCLLVLEQVIVMIFLSRLCKLCNLNAFEASVTRFAMATCSEECLEMAGRYSTRYTSIFQQIVMITQVRNF
jgi:hypothetical protein